MKNGYAVRGLVTVIFMKHKGKEMQTIIDTADLELVKQFPYTWAPHWNAHTKSFYVRGDLQLPEKKRKRVYLHRWLFEDPMGLTVDHLNHDTLDNRRSSNLRILTNGENQQNKKGARSDSRTGIRGVSWNIEKCKYEVRVGCNKKKYFIGYFSDIKEAAAAAERARKEHLQYA